LLACLMQRPNTIFSCRELAQTALGYDVSAQEARGIIPPHICRLRKKIEPDPDRPRLIRTTPGKGYFFAP
jgi:two-component system KDP operon response regulator KdpE